MSVRKAAVTTFWLIVFFAALSLLIPVIRNALPHEIIYPLETHLHPQYEIGEFYSFIVNLAIWAAIVAGTIDAVLNNRDLFTLPKSYTVLIVLAIPVIIAACIPSSSIYIFWAFSQIMSIIGLYWTFRKFICNNHQGGQKLIPFIKEIKSIGGSPIGHISDHYVVWGVSLMLLALCALQIIALIVFVGTNWNAFA